MGSIPSGRTRLKIINMSDVTTKSSGGIGFFGLLTIVFIVLKLTNVIAWSWLWVLSPLWIPFAIGLVISIIVLIGICVGTIKYV